jgi:hypothetical protein
MSSFTSNDKMMTLKLKCHLQDRYLGLSYGFEQSKGTFTWEKSYTEQ